MAGDYSDIASFPSDWPLHSVGEFADIKGGKRLPAGAALVPHRTSHPYVRIVDLKDGRVDKSALLYVSDEVFPRIARYTISSKDIYISIVGTIGLVGVIDEELDGANLTENAAKICSIASHIDRDYLAAFLRSGWGQHQVHSLTVGSTQPKLALFRIADIRVPVPSLAEQRAIAHILGTLDNKIELNRRMSETLEAMARALFKSWFVDFDPVRAKAEGRDPGLPQPLADLFPDSFEDSELGEIPRGWGVAQLDDLAAIQGGKQLPTADCQPTGMFPVFGANGIMGYASRTTHDGFVIAFGRVGAYCGSVHWTYAGAWINNNASSVVPKGWPEFVLQTMLEADFEGMRTGSAQPFIPNTSLAALQVIRAPDNVLNEFCAIVHSLRLKEQASHRQSHTLAALRDTLLPKLISGELRVKDAEKFIGGNA
jgi:type I restriction enzyme S subunit